MAMSTLRALPGTLQPSQLPSDSLHALASALLLQLETDSTAPVFVKNTFSNMDDVLYHLHDAEVCFLAF
jgi:hypothetical protein